MQPNSNANKNPLHDRNLYIIIGVTLIAIMGGQTIAPILPDLTQVFNVSPKEIELVMTVFFIPIGIATPILGLLADRIGIRKVLIPSLLLFGIAGGFSSFADSFQTLLGWRFLQGLGAASLDSLALTMIAMSYRGKSLGIAMSLNASVIGISTAIYPLTGGALGGFSWRYPFLLSVAAFPLIMLILMLLKLPPKPSSGKDDDLKSYLQTTWRSINNPAVLGLLVAVCSLFIIQFGAFITYIPILAGVNFGASGLLNGLILASMSVSLALVASQLGRLAQHTSEITLIKIAFIIIAIALLITPSIDNAWMLIVPSVLFGVAQALALPSSQALLAGLAADNAQAGFMAVNASVQSLGQAIGPLIAGISFGFWGIKGVFWTTAAISLATGALFNFLLTLKRETAPLLVSSDTAMDNFTSQATQRGNNVAFAATHPDSDIYSYSSEFGDDSAFVATQPDSDSDIYSYSFEIGNDLTSEETQIVRPSINQPAKKVYSPSPQIDDDSASEQTQIVRPSINQSGNTSNNIYSHAPTILQTQFARLIHQISDEIVELPANTSSIYVGKPDEYTTPDVDLSLFPNSKVVSRKHAVIRIEGNHYYIQDLGSSNGTYLNRYPLLPGNWYKLRSGDRLGFGKGDLVTFIWQIATA